MKVTIKIDYRAEWREEVCLRIVDSADILPLYCEDVSKWSIILDVEKKATLKYSFVVRNHKQEIVREEWGVHSLLVGFRSDYVVHNLWHDKPDASLESSPFKNCFFRQKYQKVSVNEGMLLKVRCVEVETHESVAMLGSGFLGEWNVEKAIKLTPTEYGLWETVFSTVDSPEDYKFAIIDNHTQQIVRWEDGANRILQPTNKSFLSVEELSFRNGNFRWKCAGVAIPVFSLRTTRSFGVGEFSDLKEMVDWSALVGMRIIQVLPINDTSMSETWRDSYPYNAISIYALHPIYLGLRDYPLKSKKKMSAFLKEQQNLNSLPDLDYERVIKLKREYIHELFVERGAKVSQQKDYHDFVDTNREWLFPYACFCYFRDKNKTADYKCWGRFSIYKESSLQRLQKTDALFAACVEETYFTQYLLQKQLKAVRQYALDKGVVLKGDIPIGISSDSVEAWVEPHLFNLDTQTGAPPDDFAVDGQNWGFPTYNWNEMRKDGYQWWRKRFKKMAEYFDVYRIDHILGFFRIWEIPSNAVQGILGYFSPALPLSIEDIHKSGLNLSVDRMTLPFIDSEMLRQLFGDDTDEVIQMYLEQIEQNVYRLKADFDTQRKIEKKVDDDILREGLYTLCSNVLFVKDGKEQEKLHPRISVQKTYSYSQLSEEAKGLLDAIYEDFFYHRHSAFWKTEAIEKLPALISSTDMLVCGEDLGMIPASVPEVMHELDILSLEIQRMPKTFGVQFEDMSKIPYKSVCATSTHDMSPIRLWWKEDRARSQSYYTNILKREGVAPPECSPELCRAIIELHLASPSMLSIHPLQDWLSISDSLRRENEAEEQINIPANPNHYWRYRMHLNIEDLIECNLFKGEVSKIMLKYDRGCNEIKLTASSYQK